MGLQTRRLFQPSRESPKAQLIVIHCPNEDHGPFDRVDISRMRWRPADDPPVEMLETVSAVLAKPTATRDQIGPELFGTRRWESTAELQGAMSYLAHYRPVGRCRWTCPWFHSTH